MCALSSEAEPYLCHVLCPLRISSQHRYICAPSVNNSPRMLSSTDSYPAPVGTAASATATIAAAATTTPFWPNRRCGPCLTRLAMGCWTARVSSLPRSSSPWLRQASTLQSRTARPQRSCHSLSVSFVALLPPYDIAAAVCQCLPTWLSAAAGLTGVAGSSTSFLPLRSRARGFLDSAR